MQAGNGEGGQFVMLCKCKVIGRCEGAADYCTELCSLARISQWQVRNHNSLVLIMIHMCKFLQRGKLLKRVDVWQFYVHEAETPWFI